MSTRFSVVQKLKLIDTITERFESTLIRSSLAHRYLNYPQMGTRRITPLGARAKLTIEVDFSLPSARVIRVLEQLGEIYGLPKAIRLDNGPELRSAKFTEWFTSKGIELMFIQLGTA